MKKLELVQMENLEGGRCSPERGDAQAQIAIMGLAGSMFGLIRAFGFTMLGIYMTSGGTHCI